MAPLLERALQRLRRSDAIRAQVLTYLFLARIHNIVKLSYEQYLASSGRRVSEGAGHCADSRRAQPECEPEIGDASLLTELVCRLARAHGGDAASGSSTRTTGRVSVPAEQPAASQVLEPRQRQSRQERVSGRLQARPLAVVPKDAREEDAAAAGRDWWDWRGFPELWRPLAAYDVASTAWMAWASFRTALQKQLAFLVRPLSGWLLGMPGNCLLPGRMATPVGVSTLATILFSSFHLTWRLVQRRSAHNRLITMIVFLLASERDLDRMYALIEAQDLPDGRSLSLAAPGGSRPPGVGGGGAANTWRPQQQKHWAHEQRATEQLLMQVLCYKVQFNQRLYFKLRPNRTREARRQLVRRTALMTLIGSTFFGFLFVVCTSLILLAIFSDYRYAHVYPGCTPALDKLLARNQLSYFSMTLEGHHLASIAFDVLENVFLWLDSGLAITLVPPFIYLINYDLLLYWRALDQRLESLVARTKWLLDTHRKQQQQQQEQQHQHQQHQQHQQQQPSGTAPNVCQVCSVCDLLGCPQAPQVQVPVPLGGARFQGGVRALERDLQEIQFEMFDFFHQIKRADLFVGDGLTATVLIWLASWAFVNYNQLTAVDTSEMSVLVQLPLALGFATLSLATYHLLELRHRCLGSYRTLCSLIAFDQTHNKRHFTKLMDFYSSNSASYHLCRAYAFKPTTFITIVGWSFSCFFLTFTLFKPHGRA